VKFLLKFFKEEGLNVKIMMRTATTKPDGCSSLISACFRGHLDVVKVLLAESDQQTLFYLGTGGNIMGGNCLDAAATAGHLEITRELLRAGGSELALCSRRPDGSTALHAACSNGYLDLARELVRVCGSALLHRTNAAGSTCLHIAAKEGAAPALIRFLAQAGGRDLILRQLDACTEVLIGASCLHLACMAGAARTAAELCRVGGAELMGLTMIGESTCLHAAAGTGSVEVVRMLCGQAPPAVINARDRSGWTALDLAADAGNAAMAELLRQAGAVSGRGAPARTP
jgi:ankyrin repeat protein